MEQASSLSTEWCGLIDSDVREPKSFSHLSDSLKAKAYSALIYLLGDPYASKDIRRASSASLSLDKGYFHDLLLADSIIQLSELLRTTLRPSYFAHSELRTSVKGRVNFSKTLKLRAGLSDRHFCQFPVQAFDHELFGLLKTAVPSLSAKLEARVASDLRIRLRLATNYIVEVTRNTHVKQDPLTTSIKVLCDRITLKAEMRAILAPAKVIAHYYLGQTVALDKGIGTRGLILNLNRPFEKLLLESLCATGIFVHDKEPINELYFRKANGETSEIDPMRPDCKGVFGTTTDSVYGIIDAKHKLFRENDADGEDLGRINRADLYQVTSYGLTSKHTDRYPQVVALVGLAPESSSKERFVARLPDVCITFGAKTFSIQRYTLNFGNALIAIADQLEEVGSPEKVMRAIGLELVELMDLENKAKSAG